MRALFEEMRKGDASTVRALLGRSEGIDFDCKRKNDPANGQFDRQDKQNLGRTLSAFANSTGGLLLWGVDARTVNNSTPDVISGFHPIADVRLFESNARALAAEALMPRIDDVETAVVEEPIGSGNGYLAMYVGRSERRPHRCEIADVKGYYRRALSSSRMMEHFEIEDSFRRLTVPSLQMRATLYLAGTFSGGQNTPNVSIGVEISLRNISLVSAAFPYVSVLAEGGFIWDNGRPPAQGIVRRRDLNFWHFEGDSQIVLHPDRERVMASVKTDVPMDRSGSTLAVNRARLLGREITVSFGCRDVRQQTSVISYSVDELMGIVPSHFQS